MTGKPLYQQIVQSLEDGALPQGFRLVSSDEYANAQPDDGAFDGVARMLIRQDMPDAAAQKQIARAVRAASKDDYETAETCFAALGKRCNALSLVDELQKYLFNNTKKLAANNVFNTAMRMILSSENAECVKFGLAMLELFNATDEQTKSIVRTVGLSDEFTLFAGWVMNRWENGNEEIFALAKKVHGWGRIHLVDLIEPDTEAIGEWLLSEGIRNTVDPTYSAMLVWNKANVAERLGRVLPYDEFTKVSEIIRALAESSLFAGLREVQDHELHLTRYLRQAERFTLSLRDYEAIHTVALWAEAEQLPPIVSRAQAILNSEACKKTVSEAASRGEGLLLSETLGIPFAENLYGLMCRDFAAHYPNCGFLLRNPDYAEKTVALFEENIDLELILSEPADADPRTVQEARSRLAVLLWAANDVPLIAKKFVIAGLNAKDIKLRHAAFEAIVSWTTYTEKTLRSLSPELYFELKKRLLTEPDDMLATMERDFLNDETDMEENPEDD